MDAEYANYYTREVMLILIREFQSPDEEMKKIVLKVVKQCCATDGVESHYIKDEILPHFFKHFWSHRMALDRRNYRQVIKTGPCTPWRGNLVAFALSIALFLANILISRPLLKVYAMVLGKTSMKCRYASEQDVIRFLVSSEGSKYDFFGELWFISAEVAPGIFNVEVPFVCLARCEGEEPRWYGVGQYKNSSMAAIYLLTIESFLVNSPYGLNMNPTDPGDDEN